MRRLFLAALALLCLGVGVASANYINNPYGVGNDMPQGMVRLCSWLGANCALVNKDGSLNVRPLNKSTQFGGGGTVTLGSGAATTVLPPSPTRQYIQISNTNATAANYAVCTFGATATATNGIPIAALATVAIPLYPGGPIPTDYMSCISAAGSPVIYVFAGN